jgi:Amidohydrolase family
MAHDLVIRGGTIADGSGGPMFDADIAIREGRIVEIGRVVARSREEIDARGLLVAPGFVDVHTHYDGQVTWSQEVIFHGRGSALHGGRQKHICGIKPILCLDGRLRHLFGPPRLEADLLHFSCSTRSSCPAVCWHRQLALQPSTGAAADGLRSCGRLACNDTSGTLGWMVRDWSPVKATGPCAECCPSPLRNTALPPGCRLPIFCRNGGHRASHPAPRFAELRQGMGRYMLRRSSLCRVPAWCVRSSWSADICESDIPTAVRQSASHHPSAGGLCCRYGFAVHRKSVVRS